MTTGDRRRTRGSTRPRTAARPGRCSSRTRTRCLLRLLRVLDPEERRAFSDAVTARFPAIRTTDGETWQNIGAGMPAGAGRRGGVRGQRHLRGDARAASARGSPPAERPRRASSPRPTAGTRWTPYDTPIHAGHVRSPAALNVVFRDPHHGIIAGGDLGQRHAADGQRRASGDGGETWTLATPTPFPGAVYGLAYVPGFGQRTVVATGPAGAAWSLR